MIVLQGCWFELLQPYLASSFYNLLPKMMQEHSGHNFDSDAIVIAAVLHFM